MLATGSPRVEPGGRLFQNRLHRQAVDLPLPADEGSAVVFKQQRPAGHCPRTGAGRHRVAAQEGAGIERGAARKLNFGQPDGLASASDGQRGVENRAGVPVPQPVWQTRILSGLPPRVVNVPGQGSNARIWRSIAAADWLQSIRPSSRESLGA